MRAIDVALPWESGVTEMWVRTVLVLAVTSATLGCGSQPSPAPVETAADEHFPISGEVYEWPDGTVVQPSPFSREAYVRYLSSDRYSYGHAYILIYHGLYQQEPSEEDLPHLSMISNRFNRPGEHDIMSTDAGLVVCHKEPIQSSLAYPCGLSFRYRGARWELLFPSQRKDDAVAVHQEAIEFLESIRRSSE